ncbi:MAG: metal-dependent transcriptional regulator [Actinomycetaceae bacterium]|nr:metal-dependent transcriptional regulator [Actinomycetaceae bacterium]
MGELIDTTEMYLKTIYELIEDDVVPMRARIVERLGHSGPTVSQTIARMERDGLVVVGDDRKLILTERGSEVATEVMRKHRLAERLLIDVIGLEWEFAHDEACRWEHVMSHQVEEKLVDLLACSERDPYGNPVPGEADADEDAISLATLRETVEEDEPVDNLTVSRIGEPIQADSMTMQALAALNLRRGDEISITFHKSSSEMKSRAGKVRESQVAVIPAWMEAHLFVNRGE